MKSEHHVIGVCKFLFRKNCQKTDFYFIIFFTVFSEGFALLVQRHGSFNCFEAFKSSSRQFSTDKRGSNVYRLVAVFQRDCWRRNALAQRSSRQKVAQRTRIGVVGRDFDDEHDRRRGLQHHDSQIFVPGRFQESGDQRMRHHHSQRRGGTDRKSCAEKSAT